MGLKGIVCGVVYIVMVFNGGRDFWVWGCGKNGVFGFGYYFDSWFLSFVLWLLGCELFRDLDVDGFYDVYWKLLS